jgi:NADH-quinone oxidoreductase subunit M
MPSEDTYLRWIISLQLYLPVLFAMGLLLPIQALSRRKVSWAYSAITSTISFGMTLIIMFFGFDWSRPGEMQLTDTVVWLPDFGMTFHFGIDGISLWLVALTTFLMPIVVIGSLIEVDHNMRTFHFWLHILEACLIGTFIARDALMFYACFEFSLIPLFFLIGLFGHREKLRAAKMFFLYTFTGSMLTLAGVLYVAYVHAERVGEWNFFIDALVETASQHMTLEQQSWVMLAFLAGFAIKTPLWPFHTWLPLAHTEAPTAGSVDLAGLVLKLGPYGLIRLAIPMCPAAAVVFAPYLGVFACIGVIVTALICWVQTDAKKLIAYSSVSHMGFCILGLFAFDNGNIGATGAIYYLIAHGLATGGLFICLGMLYDRFRTRDIREMSGLAREMPFWTAFFVFFALASVGLPGLNGFVGEFLTMLGTANSPQGVLGWTYAVTAATGVILAAIYLLFLVGKIVFGPVKVPAYVDQEIKESKLSQRNLHGMSWREIFTVAPLAAACLFLGLFPGPLLGTLEPAVENQVADAKAYILQVDPAAYGEEVLTAEDAERRESLRFELAADER